MGDKELLAAEGVALASDEPVEDGTKFVLNLELDFTGNDVAFILYKAGFTMYPTTPGFDEVRKFLKEVDDLV